MSPAPPQFAQLQHISPLPQTGYYGPVDPQAFSGMVMRYAAPQSHLKRSHREPMVAKGRIAAQRRRDSQGKFLKKEVALRLEGTFARILHLSLFHSLWSRVMSVATVAFPVAPFIAHARHPTFLTEFFTLFCLSAFPPFGEAVFRSIAGRKKICC